MNEPSTRKIVDREAIGIIADRHTNMQNSFVTMNTQIVEIKNRQNIYHTELGNMYNIKNEVSINDFLSTNLDMELIKALTNLKIVA